MNSHFICSLYHLDRLLIICTYCVKYCYFYSVVIFKLLNSIIELCLFLFSGIYPPNTDSSKKYSESYQVEEFDYLSKLAIGIENSARPKSDDVRSVIIRLGKLSFFFF